MSNDVNIRAELLRYYNSQSTAHVGYLISWSIAFFALFSVFVGKSAPALDGIMGASARILGNTEVGSDVALFIRSVVFSSAFTVLVHLCGRTLFWSYLTTVTLYAEPEPCGKTVFHRLSLGTTNSLLKEKKYIIKQIAKRFQTLNTRLLSGAFLIFLSICLFYEFILKELASPHQTGTMAILIFLLLGLPLVSQGFFLSNMSTGLVRLFRALSRLFINAALFSLLSAIAILIYRTATKTVYVYSTPIDPTKLPIVLFYCLVIALCLEYSKGLLISKLKVIKNWMKSKREGVDKKIDGFLDSLKKLDL